MYRELALLTDAEAELCLNGLLKGLTIRSPKHAALLVHPGDMATVIQEVAGLTQAQTPNLGELRPERRPKAIRLVLDAIAKDEELRPKLTAWLGAARPTLLEPVTTALVLAGIVLVLSTHVRIDYKKGNGKGTLEITVEKKPTDSELLTKFFDLFR